LESRVTPASGPVTLGGFASWTDGASGNHAIPLDTRVQIFGTNTAGMTTMLADNVTTDLTGNYTTTIMFDPAGGPLTVSATIFAQSPYADVQPMAGGPIFTLTSPTAMVTATGTSVTIPNAIATNSPAVALGEIFSLDSALVEAGQYSDYLQGTHPGRVDVHFGVPSPNFTGTINIPQGNGFDWDVSQHEYGHYMEQTYGFGNVFSGAAHGFMSHAAGGVTQAFSEGYADYYPVAAQQAGGGKPYAAGVPNVGDTIYTDTRLGFSVNYKTGIGVGEDDELSVAASLYHLTAGDQGYMLTDQTVFSDIKGAAATTMGAAWDSIAVPLTIENRQKVGKILGMQQIAPVIQMPADGFRVKPGDPIPTFVWAKNGAPGNYNLDTFRIEFYKSDFSTPTLLTKDLTPADYTDNGATISYQPNATDWATIFKDGHSTVKYIVEGMNTMHMPITPGGTLMRYWSAARTISGPSIAMVIDITGSMTDEIGGVITALQNFITTVNNSLVPGEEPPTMELITFRDAPMEVISSNDLSAVSAAVGALTADGGGDCPEPSAPSLAMAVDDLAPGGTILLATDASSDPGTNLDGVIAEARANGDTLNEIVSGDCSSTIEPSSPGGPSQVPACYHAAAFTAGPMAPPGSGPAADLPFDDHGDSPVAATQLPLNGSPAEGIVGNMVQAADGTTHTDNADFFSMTLQAGTTYQIPILTQSSGFLTATLLDTDGTTVLQSNSTTISDNGMGYLTLSFTPSATGTYYLNLGGAFSPVTYSVAVSTDPLAGATSSVLIYSTASAETSGTFLFKDNVKSGSTTDLMDYQSALYNVMLSTIQPVVVASNPNHAPEGQTMQLALSGVGTNWRNGGTSVSFSGTGLTVNSVDVLSATSLTVSVSVDPAAATGFRDVTVQTMLGSTTETATGSGVLQVDVPITTPTLLQVTPSSLHQGDMTTVVFHGVMTSWDSTSTLSLGPGLTVTSQTTVSATEIDAQVSVDPGAQIGFRVASVTTAGLTQSLDRALFIYSGSAFAIASITAINPTTGFAGQTEDVQITGSNTSFVAGVTTASFGDGVTVTGVDVTDATHATAHITIANNAAVGFRNLTVTTNAETAALLQGFFISPPGPASQFQLTLSTMTVVVGQTFNLTVTARDAMGNLATGYTGTVALGTSDGAAMLPSPFTYGSADTGVHTFQLTLQTAGIQTITAVDTSHGSLTATVTVTVSPGPSTVASFSLSAPKRSPEGSPVQVTVSALNAAGQVVAGYVGTVHFGSSDSLAGLPPDFAFSPSDGGLHTFTITLATVGYQTMTVTDAANAVSGTATIQVVARYYAVGADAGGGPQVNVYDARTGALTFAFFAYTPAFSGGVRVAVGDINGDGTPDIITAPGPGGGPDIRVFDGVTGQLIREFMAYDPNFAGGVYVAVGDVNGDGFADIITGADAGGGPQVTVFSGKDNSVLMSFFPYDPNFHGGVRVAAADVNSDGFADIITAAGPGGGPEVRVFSGKDGSALQSFFAYDPNFGGGVYVGAGDVNGDGFADIITGAGPGGGPEVRVFSGKDGSALQSFFAYSPAFTGGVRVAYIADVNADGRGELATAAGPGGGPQATVFRGTDLSVVDSFFAFDPNFPGGIYIGGK
jgi:hypothetical protein